VALPFLLVLAVYFLPLILKEIFLPTIALPLDDFKVAVNLILLAFFLEMFLALRICFTTILLETTVISTMAKQTIRIRVRLTGGNNGTYKPCGNCGGTGVVRNNRGNQNTGVKK